MMQVLKIAAGVLLGIVGAFSLYVAFEMWQLHNLAKERAEEQRLETVKESARAAEQKVRISKAADGLVSVSPDELINRCGPPSSDSRGAGGFHRGWGNVYLGYLGADGNSILVELYCSDQFCSWGTMARPGRSEYQEIHPMAYEPFFAIERGKKESEYHRASPESQVKELPCLAGTAVN